LPRRSAQNRVESRAVRPASLRAARFVAATLLAAATALATLSAAQTKKPAPKPKPATKADASAIVEEPTANDAEAPKALPAIEPAAASEPPSDGGVRPSPLNPERQEMPRNGADAGAPLDYDRLLADIAALRARVAAVSDNLYQSRIAIALENDSRHGKIARLSVSVDDGIVYTAPSSFAASDMTKVYDHAVAPGRHAVTIELDRKDDRDEGFRNSQRSRFTVDVPRDHRLLVEVRLTDDSTMGGDFPGDKSGKYDLRFRVKAVATPAGK
jgi:hypothetical protein